MFYVDVCVGHRWAAEIKVLLFAGVWLHFLFFRVCNNYVFEVPLKKILLQLSVFEKHVDIVQIMKFKLLFNKLINQ